MTTNPKTLADLKPGDEVILINRYGNHVATVEKVTKLHVILHSGQKFRVRDGGAIRRERWNYEYIKIPAAGEIEAIRAETARKLLCSQTDDLWRLKKYDLTIDQLRAILEILK